MAPPPLRVALLDRVRGLDAWARYRDYLQSQWDPPEVRWRMQEQKLRQLLTAAASVPFYRGRVDARLAADPNSDPWQLLGAQPILTRAAARTSAAALLTEDAHARSTARRKATGGSTGEPLRYYLSPEAQSAQWAHLWRAWNAAGYAPGQALGIVAGRSLLAGDGVRRHVYNRLQNWSTLDAFALSESAMARFARTLRSRRVRFLYGYASALETFARWLEATHTHLSLQAVFTTAEQLLPAARTAIETGTGTRVFDTYGANDGGISAFECEAHNGLHLGAERCWVEIVREDGTPAEPGEVGRILSTDLNNHAFPFLRYEVGDLAAMVADPCACGRTLARLTQLSGRLSDVIVLADGRRVHGELFSHFFRPDETVRRYQAIQTSRLAVEVRLSVGRPRSEQELAHLRARLAALLPGLDVSLRLTEEFIRTDAGKVPLVVSLRAGGASALTDATR